tara:strand:+ start:525 stop:1634 length:1110 start_codon:yes stop_codon:yes gene_type:complete
MNLLAIDGAPGTGKTRTIVESSKTWGERSAVVTYTNDAAHVLHQRAPDIVAGTIYSLTWKYVSAFCTNKPMGTTSNLTYGKRRVHHVFDTALEQYTKDAPGKRKVDRYDEMAKQLHAWREGFPPFSLDKEQARGALKFLLPVARWVEAGCPIHPDEQVDLLVIDEAQDMSWLELRAAQGLVSDNGRIEAYGDPGQAIFGHSKGMIGNQLPPVWVASTDTQVLDKGWRVGDNVATVASRVLSSYYNRPPHMFRAEHSTSLVGWEPNIPPTRGLVLGYSRFMVAKAFKNWNLSETGIVPKIADADVELVLSTGHAAKGAEADDVYLLPWSKVALDRLMKKDAETLRLLYVMLTRARKRVHIPITLKARLPM